MPQTKNIEKFISTLKKHGMKATSQRLAIHQAMLELGHASADMVCDFLAEHSPTHITIASVYNTLTQMADIGIYSYCNSFNNKKYFDVTSSTHIHMYDSVNHSFRDVMDEKLYDDILERIGTRRFKGYTIDKVDIQFVVHPTKKKVLTRKK